VPTKNSNPGLATGFWKLLAVRVNERRWFSFLNRERSPTGGCDGQLFPAGLMGEMGSLGSGRLSFVPMMKPADLRDRHDATIARRGDRARDRRVLVQRQVRA
jgi:hypothetical protein